MSSLAEFSSKIRKELAAAEVPSGSQQSDDDYMAGIRERAAQFQLQADRIRSEIVEPRVRLLGTFFSNAAAARKAEPGHCTWWFGYTERFPFSTKLDLFLSHDERVETIELCYESLIVPVFVKYDRFDRLVLPLRQINDEQIAAWLENRLLRFVHTYLGLGTSNRDQSEALATDVVCGMRIPVDRAAGHHDHAGHRYFFCSNTCREEFAANPTRYVTVVTL